MSGLLDSRSRRSILDPVTTISSVASPELSAASCATATLPFAASDMAAEIDKARYDLRNAAELVFIFFPNNECNRR
jgi:hypothetical protein